MTQDINSLFSLKGKTALITGASRGIGEEIARCYALAGARVVICSRKIEGLEKAAQGIRELGGEVLAVAANIANTEGRGELMQKALEWSGRLDILVNNVGANPVYGGLDRITEEEFEKVLAVNLKASLFLAQAAYHAWMKENGGSIINVSSIGGSESSFGINGYNVAKAALNHLTRCLASEWGRHGIRVNALAPGLIKTSFSQALWENPAFQKAMQKNPIPRIGEVEDMAGAALYMASDASSYMTGHILTVDGGSLVANK